MSDIDGQHPVTNIVGHAGHEVSEEMQPRLIAYWTNVDPQLGARVAAGLGNGNATTSGHAAELVAGRTNRA